ncbi:MAG: heavy-metal-associated domain-containing protein [Defluviitaleaceae bacterium]|nr:heavy-metal-associated domain-containing protein [Defluviitaleaceae bacterium]
MKKITTLLIAFTVVFIFSACNGNENDNTIINLTTEQNTLQANEQNTEPTTTTTELTVWGMTCGRCENKIVNALSALDEVVNISVNLNTDTVTVEHAPNLDVTIIESVITREGFNIP